MCPTQNSNCKANMGGIYEDFLSTMESTTCGLASTEQQTKDRSSDENPIPQNIQSRHEQIETPSYSCRRLKDFSQSPISTITTSIQYPQSLPDENLSYFQFSQGPNESQDEDADDFNEVDEEDYRVDEDELTCKSSRRNIRRSSRKKPSPNHPGYTAKHHRRHFVQHNYHDHSRDKTRGHLANGEFEIASTKGGVVTPFPIVLHNMLDNDDEGLSHIVSWQPHGRAFCVQDSKAFVSRVMPNFFRQTKISSFQRQLNLYGFARLTNPGPDKGAYYHEYFLRGRPDLTVHMHRTRVKGTGVRTSSNPMEEPNFYEMPPIAPKEEVDAGGIPHVLPITTSSQAMNHSGIPRQGEMRYSPQKLLLGNNLLPLSSNIDTREPSMSLSPRDIGTVNNDHLFDLSAPDVMDMEDIDIKDMASFLSGVDLSAKENESTQAERYGSYLSQSMDFSKINSTPV